MDRLKQIVEKEFESKKMSIFAKVGEEIESLKKSVLTKIESYMKDENQTSAETNMKLEFRNRIARTILTGEEIRGEGGVTIEVALVDDLAGGVVDDEPEASANVEIVLLKASETSDWTAEEFNATIVPQVEGKQPILAGNVALQLQRGIVLVKNIKIRHHASKIKPPEFMLGARVVGDCCIKEAKTEPFILKDYRIKYKEKRENPSLIDEVSRLVFIGRGGEIHKRLQENNIHTVEDFLIQLLINPQGLKTIAKPQAAKWKATIENARACESSERKYCYIDPKHNTGVVFDILGHVQGLCSGSYYYWTSTLSEEQKAEAEKLFASACRNWKQVKAFNDQNSLQQHLDALSPYIDRTRASEVVGESSNMHLNVSFHSANAAMDLSGQGFGSFTTADTDDSFFDNVDEQICNLCNIFQHDGLINETNADEGSGAASLEPGTVGRRKRWRELFCVFTFTFRKRVSPDVCPSLKKQKVG